MMQKKHVLLLAAASVVTLSLAACAGPDAESGDGAGDALKIGIVFPQTGSYAEFGNDFADGAQLAIAQANADGFDGKAIEVEAFTCDSEIDPAKAAACGRRLATEDGVVGIVNATSAESLALIAFNQTGSNPFVLVSSSVSQQLVNQGNTLVARFWLSTKSYLAQFTELLAQGLEEQGVKDLPSVAVITVNDDFGKGWTTDFVAGWEKQGGTIAGEPATYQAGATDLYPQLTSLLASNPDLIAAPGTCAQTGLAVTQARELGFTGHFISQASCSPTGLLAASPNADLEGSIFEGTAWDIGSPAADAFKEAFSAKYGRDANLTAANGYEQVSLIIAAAIASGSTTDPAAIRAAMPDVMTVEQPWNFIGAFDLQENGESSVVVHPRFYNSPDDIVDFLG